MSANKSRVSSVKSRLVTGNVAIETRAPNYKLRIEELVAPYGLVTFLIETIKQTLFSIGLFIENSIAKVKEISAEWGRFGNLEVKNKIQLQDQATGKIYCVWIENGEWKKSGRKVRKMIISKLHSVDKF